MAEIRRENQLRLVVYLPLFTSLYIHPKWLFGISAINSRWCFILTVFFNFHPENFGGHHLQFDQQIFQTGGKRPPTRKGARLLGLHGGKLTYPTFWRGTSSSKWASWDRSHLNLNFYFCQGCCTGCRRKKMRWGSPQMEWADLFAEAAR